MNLLGNTLPEIAWEKAGIIKSNIPVVIGETQNEIVNVFEKEAKLVNTSLFFADNFHKIKNYDFIENHLQVEIESYNNPTTKVYNLELTGLYQQKNLITVLEAVNQLQSKGWNIKDEHVSIAVNQVRKITGFHGRWELLQSNPRVIVDVGHNEDGFKQILQQIAVTRFKQLHLIIGMVKDKDVDRVMALLPAKAQFYFTRADIPRAMPELDLAEIAAKYQHFGNCFPNVNIALNEALNNANLVDLILICGSVFLAGEVNLLQEKMKDNQ
jgi:dihydrofolate synthase/folylpolyglutamate synthase